MGSLIPTTIVDAITFLLVLIRFSIMFSVLPYLGDKMIPAPVRVSLSLLFSIVLWKFASLSGRSISETDLTWSLIYMAVVREIFFALVFSFVAKGAFEAIQFGANLCGNLMGFASASIYDPHQETQTEIIGQFFSVFFMLLFLIIWGDHFFIRTMVGSLHAVPIGTVVNESLVQTHLIEETGKIIKIGVTLAGPLAVLLFGLNVVYALFAKAMPQMNLMAISFGFSVFMGLAFLSFEFASIVDFMRDQLGEFFLRWQEWMHHWTRR